MNLIKLRTVLEPLILGLKDTCTHATLEATCQKLDLPIPSIEGSKFERMAMSLSLLKDSQLPNVAQLFMSQYLLDAATRNLIQDILWSEILCPAIPKRSRREIAQAIEKEILYGDMRRFDELLDTLWVLGEDYWFTSLLLEQKDTVLRTQIKQHVHKIPRDWTVDTLFDRLGAYDSTDHRFTLFLEGLASADVRPDESAQRHFVSCVNKALKNSGTELRETDNNGGYPVFTLVSSYLVSKNRPKNLIFASPEKPDLRFIDAINNDIEIVNGADKVLVYDKPISNDGLRWCDLQAWWGELNEITDTDNAKKQLYRRLHKSLPLNSPPQIFLFEAFYKGFGSAIPKLPALLPEVWLHWDPHTVKERGRDALLRFRMDFLLLLPQGIRVVIEVDGKHHYANSQGIADVQQYAQMVKGDRELKLSGYEVFRFGAAELQGQTATSEVISFFTTMFKRYGVHIEV